MWLGSCCQDRLIILHWNKLVCTRVKSPCSSRYMHSFRNWRNHNPSPSCEKYKQTCFKKIVWRLKLERKGIRERHKVSECVLVWIHVYLLQGLFSRFCLNFTVLIYCGPNWRNNWKTQAAESHFCWYLCSCFKCSEDMTRAFKITTFWSWVKLVYVDSY